MTIEEKQKAIRDYCEVARCTECPLHDAIPRNERCFGEGADVERNFTIVFPDYVDKPESTTNAVNHPGHYNREGAMECIDEMILIFGKQAVAAFCLCNAWKYRYRAADKNGLEDLKKSDWYLAKYNELIGGDGE